MCIRDSYETVKNLYSQYSSLNENKSAGEYDDSKIDSALKALKDNAAHEGGGKSIARSSPPRAYSVPSSVSKSKQTSESKAESTEGGNAIENPLVKVQKVKASGSSWLIKGNKKKGKTNPDGISGRLQE